MTPTETLLDRAKTSPSKVAFIAGGDKWTYQQLAMQADRLARGLTARGIRKGDRIALHMPNQPELAVALYACLHIGAIAVPLNNRLKAAELEPLLQRLQPALYVGHVDLYGHARAVDSSALPPERCFVAGNASEDIRVQPWADLLLDVPASVPTTSDIHSPAVLLPTSGTTGVPKFVIHTNSTLAAIADIWEHFGLHGETPQSSDVPWFTRAVFGCVHFGAPMILFERFDPDAVLDAIEPHGCTWQLGQPFMFAAMLERQRTRKRNVKSLRFCLTGGDVCSPRLQRDFGIEFGVPLRSIWAATEAAGSLTHGLQPGPVSRIAGLFR